MLVPAKCCAVSSSAEEPEARVIIPNGTVAAMERWGL